MFLQRLFTVEVLTACSHLLECLDHHDGLMLSTGLYCKRCLPRPQLYVSRTIACHKLSTPENRGSHRPWACALHTQTLIIPWVMEATSQNLSQLCTATEDCLLGNGPKPGPSGVSHRQAGVTTLILRVLQRLQSWRTSSFSQTPWPPRKNLRSTV